MADVVVTRLRLLYVNFYVFSRLFIFSFPQNVNSFTGILQNLITGEEQLHSRTNFLKSNYQCLNISFEVNVSDNRTTRAILFSCIPKKEVFFKYLVSPNLVHKKCYFRENLVLLAKSRCVTKQSGLSIYLFSQEVSQQVITLSIHSRHSLRVHIM